MKHYHQLLFCLQIEIGQLFKLCFSKETVGYHERNCIRLLSKLNESRTRNRLITFFIKTHAQLATNCNTKELLCPQNVSLIMQIVHKGITFFTFSWCLMVI